MKQEDIKLLNDHGWDVNCESPFEIEHRESGTTAEGFIAEMVLTMIKSGVVSYLPEGTCG